MEKTIFLSDVLSEMRKIDDKNKPVPFSIKVRSFSVQNKKGGEIKNYPYATLLQAPKQKGTKRLAMNADFKNPNHYENRTRNIKLNDQKIKKINILFIDEFNGKKVVY